MVLVLYGSTGHSHTIFSNGRFYRRQSSFGGDVACLQFVEHSFHPRFFSHFSKSLSALNFQSLCCSIPFSGKEFSLFRGFKGIKTYLIYTCVLEYLVTRLEFTFCRTSVQQVAAARRVFFTCQCSTFIDFHTSRWPL